MLTTINVCFVLTLTIRITIFGQVSSRKSPGQMIYSNRQLMQMSKNHDYVNESDTKFLMYSAIPPSSLCNMQQDGLKYLLRPSYFVIQMSADSAGTVLCRFTHTRF